MIPPRLFTAYRILALVVGVLLVVGTLAFIGEHALAEGSALQDLGTRLQFIWVFHGWIYIAYVVVAFVLTRKAGWRVPELVVMLLAGLVPVTIFFVEARVSRKLREEHPELQAA